MSYDNIIKLECEEEKMKVKEALLGSYLILSGSKIMTPIEWTTQICVPLLSNLN